MNEFKMAMRGLCQSIGIITACDDGQWAGMTASSIASVSMDPPSVLVCVNRGASIHSAITRSRQFCINFLADGHGELSRLFSSPMSNEDRFRHGSWSAEADGPPELEGALSVLACNLEHASTFATHTIFVGRVRTATVESEALPLVYMKGKYHLIGDRAGCVSA